MTQSSLAPNIHPKLPFLGIKLISDLPKLSHQDRTLIHPPP